MVSLAERGQRMRDRSHSKIMDEQFRAAPVYAAESFAHILRDWGRHRQSWPVCYNS